ncbi:hypothetical protein IEO21_02610 [Rhodonia placenta]|uniref:Nuclear rim protein 1 n=1 Tax=Rhodonia placenta TaxID=104341 RepID=A0A8H7U4Z8_9APHY|nr:hypothetical protein IEO21_02610 [Postia placenta]
MSQLRRFAQTNNATVGTSTPRRGSTSASPASVPSTPVRGTPVPVTPRTRLVYPISPATSPSISASTPFDWEAARSQRPPPYATPLQGKRVRGLRQSEVGTPGAASPGPLTPGGKRSQRVVRKKGLVERISSIPSEIAFQISLFPHNVPLPSSVTSAYLLGGFLHFLHLCVRVARISRVPDSDLGWEDMYREGEGDSWFDWTIPTATILFSAAVLNTLYLFTRTRIYQLTLASDPVSSPHAAYVSRPRVVRPQDDNEPPRRRIQLGSLALSLLSHLGRALMLSIRFLLNLSPPKAREQTIRGINSTERIQQLEVWTPGELESTLFAIYSPVHALLWTAVTSANWMLICCIMGTVSVQMRAMTRAYETLLKDRAIIAAEVLHEYDEKFVYPRVMPVRKDAAVMTHQSEMVDVWTN